MQQILQKQLKKIQSIFAESLENPKLDVLDLKAIAAESKAFKVPFMVDNTVASPYLLNPLSTVQTL
jgi:O-acetylhomoserine (thiol)-lyase